MAERILIVAPSWVGDLVMATPAFRCIRKRFAGAHVAVVVRKYARLVIEDTSWFDEVVEMGPAEKGMRGTLRFGARLRREKFDLAVLFSNSFRSAFLSRLARIPRIAGYSRGGRGALLTERMQPKRERKRFVPTPMLDYYLELCRRLGCDVSDRRLELFYRPGLLRELDDYSVRNGIDWSRRVVLLNAGAAFGSAKCWPPEYFARAAELLSVDPRVQVAVVCAPGERDTAVAIAKEAKCPVRALVDEPMRLDLLKPLVERASLLVTNDTGTRHYAAALGTPVVTIFGATDTRWSDTGYEKETIVRAKNLDHPPCMRRRCPMDHRCMRRVTPEMVVEAARGLLEQHPRAR